MHVSRDEIGNYNRALDAKIRRDSEKHFDCRLNRSHAKYFVCERHSRECVPAVERRGAGDWMSGFEVAQGL